MPEVTTADEVRVRLREELEPMFDGPCTFTHEPVPIEGGFSTDLFEFELDHAPRGLDGPLVLRLLDEDEAAAAREQQVHMGVIELGLAAPAVSLVGGSSSAFGRSFTIMQRLDGAPAVELRGLGALRAFRDAPTLVADSMLALHALDAGPVAARLVRAGIDDDQLGVDAALSAIATEAEDTATAEALGRLIAARPREGRPVVVHGDLHVLNLWRRPDGTITLLDWELSTIGPAELDIARSALILRLVPGEVSRAVRPLIMRFGQRAASAFTASYAERRPFDSGLFRWCTGLHALRLLTVVLRGNHDDSIARQWRPVSRRLVDLVEEVTDVRVYVRGSR
jgi:aminoglycoside phosphotransferase (APT) family kinase protein